MAERPRFDFGAITPQDSPKRPEDVFGDPQVRDLATPKLAPGDPAFDGDLPDRLYLIGRGATVAFQGEPGPFGFDPTALEKAIRRELGG